MSKSINPVRGYRPNRLNGSDLVPPQNPSGRYTGVFALSSVKPSEFKYQLFRLFHEEIKVSTDKLDPTADLDAKDVFLRSVTLALNSVVRASKREGISHAGVIRHYIFMINQAIKSGGNYLTAAAIMLHNLDEKTSRLVRKSLLNKHSIKLADEVLEIRKRFLQLRAIKYRPWSKPKFFIQNFLNALICVARGNGHALLIHIVHKLSDLELQIRIDERQARKIHEIYAPLAERLGLGHLCESLSNRAFEREKPEEYWDLAENMELLLKIWGFNSRAEAEGFLKEIEDQARKVFSGKPAYRRFGLVSVRSRIKSLCSIQKKIADSKRPYMDIADIKDILAVEMVTQKAFPGGKAALDLAIMTAFEVTEGKALDVGFENMQTETKRLEAADGKIHKKFHIDVICQTPGEQGTNRINMRHVEIQIMPAETHTLVNRAEKAHWIYYLKKETGQQFDVSDIAEYGKMLTGNFLDDARIIYKHLNKRWVYFFNETPPRSKEPGVLRVLRLERGATVKDAIAQILPAEARPRQTWITKIWKNEFHPAIDSSKLEDGDIIQVDF